MADYINPFAGLPEASTNNNPIWGAFQSGKREAQMRPFMDMAQQSQQMELEKQRATNQEFMSQDAVAARLGKLQESTAQSKFNVEKARMDLERLPIEQKQKIAQINEEMRKTNSAPAKELFTEMARISDVLEQTPPEHRPMVYKQWADQTQQKLGRPLPDQYQNYNPSFLDEAKNIKYGLVFTPEHAQKMGEIKATGANSMAVAQEHSRSAANVAGINQRGAMERQKYVTDQGRPVNIPQRIVQLRKAITDPTISEDAKQVAKEELRGYVMETFDKRMANDPQIKALANAAIFDESAKGKLEKIYEQRLGQFLKQNGLEGGKDLSDDGQNSQKAVQAFGSYEPDKYEYGINPQTGNFGRRPKGK